MLEDPFYEEPRPQPGSRFWSWTLLGWLFVIALVGAALVNLAGCAEDRYLSKEQDAEMRGLCEQQGGCTVLPTPMWKQIERILGIAGT